jgi:L,D-transpeptidase YcbB
VVEHKQTSPAAPISFKMLKMNRNISRHFLYAVVLAIAFQFMPYHQIFAGDPSDNLIKIKLRKRIEQETAQAKFRCRGELICGPSLVPIFYQRRGFVPAWSSGNRISPQAAALITEIQNANSEGLRPDDYHLPDIIALMKKIEKEEDLEYKIDPKLRVDLDLILTDAFMLYGSHLLAGRVNPETIHADWTATIPEIDLTNILQSALESNDLQKSFKELEPSDPGYLGLKKYLAHYRNIAAKIHWLPPLPETKLQKGDNGPGVRNLRERLILFGDLDASSEDRSSLFDENLETAVMKYQKRNGLKQDGVAGPRTLNQLNTPIEKWIRRIELNMERFRWLPRDFGERYLIVNIADFKLYVVENHRRVLEMPVIVGKYYRRTPVFNAKMTYMVIDPYWNIPHRLAVQDVLPKIQNDISYIDQQGIKVFKDWRNGAEEIDPKTIAWNNIGPHNFPYKLRQDPGPNNPMGRIKFMLPNKFSVFLHDTPGRSLFKASSRVFSSGCIRIEKPIDLALYLLQNDPNWSREKLMEAIENGKPRVIRIQNPIIVYLQYWTAWVDEFGKLNFCEDIYHRDGPLDRALRERISGPH